VPSVTNGGINVCEVRGKQEISSQIYSEPKTTLKIIFKFSKGKLQWLYL
jgi:hypothetical protein